MSVPPLNVFPVTNPLQAPHPPGQPCPLLDDLEFVVMDLETTGWSPEQDAITEVGAVRVRGGRVLGELACLVNPGAPVPAEITALTGLTDAMLALAPPIGIILPAVLSFAAGCVLVAHNAPFDVGFVAAAAGAAGLNWPATPVLDTLPLARALLGADEVPDHKLTTLTTHFGLPHEPSHRALSDARATAALLTILLARAAERGLRTLCGLLAWLDVIQAAAAVG
jgi:DNA polymerase III subunit epsilon